MSRFLLWFGCLFGAGGIAGGTWFLITRHAAFTSEAARRDFLAPLKWQLSLGAGVTIIVLSIALGVIMVGVGWTLRRVERLNASSEKTPPTAPDGMR